MMPQFTYPWALLLLLFLPFLVWQYLGRRSGAWQFSDARLFPTTLSLRARLARWVSLALRLCAITFSILALAGPRWVNQQRIETEGIAIAMVVDVSVSMATEDFVWEGKKESRLVGVKKLFRLFVKGGKGPDDAELPGRPNDLIALITFATYPEPACALTLEHDALLKMMDKQDPPNDGTTNPGDALGWALDVLHKAPTKRKVIVFLTDGESNVPDKLKPLQAGQLAASMGIPIYAIDASPAKPATPDAENEAKRARANLQSLASMTQGSYFRASDGNGLLKAYEQIDRLERERILSFQYRRYYEAFHWFALAALACWLTLIALEATAWRKVP